MRAIGTYRKQVRRMIFVESSIISIFGAFLGTGLGIFFAWMGVAVVSIFAAIFALFSLRSAVGIKFELVLRGDGILFVMRQGRVWRSLILAYFLFSFGTFCVMRIGRI